MSYIRHASRFITACISLVLILFCFQNCGPSFELSSLDGGSNIDLGGSPLSESGEILFSAKCASCHGALSNTTKRDVTVSQIKSAMDSIPAMNSLRASLNDNDLLALETALRSQPMNNTCNTQIVGHVVAHRLNNNEYNNVIRDITGLDLKPASKLPADAYSGFFSNMAAALSTDMARAQIYMDVALEVLDKSFAQARGNIVTCNPSTMGNRACAEKVVTEFGLKAFRRPLTATEKGTFVNLFDTNFNNYPASLGGSAFDEALKSALQGILISPQFLYRIIEMPSTDPNYIKTLNAYELASRLSFFLWGSIPDATLFSLAANGAILDQIVLLGQVDRMLKDPKASHLSETFGSQWLKVEGINRVQPDRTVFPEFNETLRQSMAMESKLLLDDIFRGDGSPYLIFNADYTYVNNALSSFYQIGNVTTSNFQRVSLVGTPRIGILTHASILTVNSRKYESSIVHRGMWALDRILCQPIGAPPPNAPNNLPPDTPSSNPRMSLAAHTSDPVCASCHKQIDPVGHGLENFSGIGKYRTTYRNGDTVDASGQFTNGITFTGAHELSQAIIQNPKFKSCYARNLMSYSLGRLLNDNDKCAADTFASTTVAPNRKFSDLVKAIVTSQQFLKQKGAN